MEIIARVAECVSSAASGAAPVLTVIVLLIQLYRMAAESGLSTLGARGRDKRFFDYLKKYKLIFDDHKIGLSYQSVGDEVLAQEVARCRYPAKIGYAGKNFIVFIAGMMMFGIFSFASTFLVDFLASMLFLAAAFVGLIGALAITPLLMFDVPSYARCREKVGAWHKRREVLKRWKSDDSLGGDLMSLIYLPLDKVSDGMTNASSCLLVDARSEVEWRRDGLPGSISCDRLNSAALNPGISILVYSNFGGRSIECVFDLRKSGFYAYNLGGFLSLDNKFRRMAEKFLLLGRWSSIEVFVVEGMGESRGD